MNCSGTVFENSISFPNCASANTAKAAGANTLASHEILRFFVHCKILEQLHTY